MIGIQDQYLIKFDVGEKKDFLNDDDLILCTVIEDAGNVLPTFELSFYLSDVNVAILPYLNEGNIINLSYGRTQDDFSDSELRILNKIIRKAGKSKIHVVLNGVFNAPDFVGSGSTQSYPQKSGVETVLEVAKKSFNIDSNITKSDDTQTWIQHNIPDKRFINNTWIHSYLNNSFIAVGISSDGTFILKDITKAAGETPNWRCIQGDPTKDNEILYDSDYIVNSSTGFINQWFGYNRTKSLRTLETANDSVLDNSVNTFLSLSGSLDRAPTTGNRISEFGMLNDNVHENYWKAYQQNLSYLTTHSSVKLEMSFQKEFKKVKVLDLVYFEDRDYDDIFTIEQVSGLYFVTKVARNFSSKQLSTVVNLSRESFGKMKGEFQ